MPISTTISAVLGADPFSLGTLHNVSIDSDTRPAARTWLGRCGWTVDSYIALDCDTLYGLYTSRATFEAGCAARGLPVASVADCIALATQDYAPRNARLLAHLAKRGGGAAAATATAAAATAAGGGDKADQLAALLRDLAGSRAAPLDESRVIELIAAHAGPRAIRHDVTVTDAAGAARTITGAHPQLAELLVILTARDPLSGRYQQPYIVGPTASGKTHACEQAAEALQTPFYLHGAMAMSHELMGFVDAAGNYHRTPFRDAFERGGLCLLDELDSWDAAVTLALNAALANGVAAFPDGMVRRHMDCRIAGAANTWGSGATAEYVGRTRLDAAFLSRFPVRVAWERDAGIEAAMSGGNESWAKRVRAARERAKAAGLKVMIDPRHTAAGAALIAAGITEKRAAELTYLAGLSPDQIRMVEA